jgi:peptide/nickel transport system substrate-binding protein
MKLRRWTALAAAGLLALTACGGDDDSGDDDTTAPTSAAPGTTAGGDSSTTEGDASTTTEGGDATTTSAAEAPTTSAAPDAGEDCSETVPGSELDFGVYAPAASLDPLQTSGALVGGTDIVSIYDAMMRWDADTNEWVPHLAESLTSNADHTEWTLTLRPGITYSNGDVMVAQDVLDNFQRLTGPGRNPSRAAIARVDLANSSAPDDTTVVFKTFKPWANFGYVLGDSPGMVVNPEVGAVMDGTVTKISTDPTGAGAGPYTVERWAPGESPYLVLKARPDYWGGAPCIETINFINIPTDQPKLDALELGELDIAFLRTANIIAEARESGEYEEHMFLQSAGVNILINQGAGNFNPIAQDVRFRRAVAAAIDSSVLSQRAFGGELLEQRGFVHPDSFWYSEGSPTVEADPALAASLVEELKGEGWDGNIRLICADTVPDAAVAYEAALEAAGMSVDLQVTDTNTHIAAVAVNIDYDMACWGFALSDSALTRQVASNFGSQPPNRIGYSSPAFEAAIDALFAAEDAEAARDAVRTMAEIYAEEVPVAIVGAVEEGIMIRDNVTGVVPTQQSVFFFHDARVTD